VCVGGGVFLMLNTAIGILLSVSSNGPIDEYYTLPSDERISIFQ